MKHLIVLSLLAGLTACSSSQKESGGIYVCLTPFTPLSGLSLKVGDPNVKDNGGSLSVTNPQGDTLTIPKTLCVQVHDAKTD